MEFSRAEILLLTQVVMDAYAEKCACIDDVLETLAQTELSAEDKEECEEVINQLELEAVRLLPLLDKLEGKQNPNIPLKRKTKTKGRRY